MGENLTSDELPQLSAPTQQQQQQKPAVQKQSETGIVMHQSFVTTPLHPRRRAGDSCGIVLCFYFSMLGKCQGFVSYRQKWQCNKNRSHCGGKGPWFYQLAVPAVWGILQDEMSKFPLFSVAGGRGYKLLVHNLI